MTGYLPTGRPPAPTGPVGGRAGRVVGVRRPRAEPTLWPAGRWGCAAAAGLVAALTGGLAVMLSHTSWALPAALAHVVAAVVAVAVPPAVVAQVAAGLVLAWTTLPGTDGPTPAVVPVVAGVVATAELVGAAARLGTVVARDPLPLLRRAAGATAIAAVASSVAVAAGAAGGLGGLTATLVGACACLAVFALVRADR